MGDHNCFRLWVHQTFVYLCFCFPCHPGQMFKTIIQKNIHLISKFSNQWWKIIFLGNLSWTVTFFGALLPFLLTEINTIEFVMQNLLRAAYESKQCIQRQTRIAKSGFSTLWVPIQKQQPAIIYQFLFLIYIYIYIYIWMYERNEHKKVEIFTFDIRLPNSWKISGKTAFFIPVLMIKPLIHPIKQTTAIIDFHTTWKIKICCRSEGLLEPDLCIDHIPLSIGCAQQNSSSNLDEPSPFNSSSH